MTALAKRTRARHAWPVPRRKLSICVLSLAACRPDPASTEVPDANAEAAPPKAESTGADDTLDRVVARVDGREITEEAVQRQLANYPEGTAREDVLFSLIQREVFEAEAARMQVDVSGQEIGLAAETIARDNGLSLDELKAEVAKQTKLTWAQYEQELRAQLLEYKVLQLLGVHGTTEEAYGQQQSRVRRCLRARSEIEILGDAIVLPENPYAVEIALAGIAFEGDVVLDPKALEAALREKIEAGQACDVLLAVEPILFQQYLEAGYLRAKIDVQWPEQPQPQTELKVIVHAGKRHEVGTITFDQSGVPADRQLDDKKLRKVVAGVLKTGDVAAGSKLNGAGERLNELLRTMSRPPAALQTDLVDDTDVVNLTFVLADG